MSTNDPFSYASPMSSGMVHAQVVSVNRSDNSVQVRLHGYQDNEGMIPDDKLEWVKCLSSSHSGIAGATGTHNYYPGAWVMVSMSGTEKFIVGSVTGYDSDKSKDKKGADDSENEEPNVPRMVRGSKGPSDVSTGTGEDKTSKSSRNVSKTDGPYDKEEPKAVFDYSKGTAPFDKGSPATFPDLKSIGVGKLKKGSDVLNVIDQMDGNASGAIREGTKLIRGLRQGGFGAAMGLLNGGGGASNQATSQVTDYFGSIPLMDLLSALQDLLVAKNLVDHATTQTNPADLRTVPYSLQYTVFQVDPGVQEDLQSAVTALELIPKPQDRGPLISVVKSRFMDGFRAAVANSLAYVSGLIQGAGTVAILVSGTSDVESLYKLIGVLQSGAAASGMPPSAVTGMGGGSVGRIASLGQPAINEVMMGAGQHKGRIQSMLGQMNTFKGEMNAMKEIMGGNSSLSESLTGITMKFRSKRSNHDETGFTK